MAGWEVTGRDTGILFTEQKGAFSKACSHVELGGNKPPPPVHRLPYPMQEPSRSGPSLPATPRQGFRPQGRAASSTRVPQDPPHSPGLLCQLSPGFQSRRDNKLLLCSAQHCLNSASFCLQQLCGQFCCSTVETAEGWLATKERQEHAIQLPPRPPPAYV